MSRKCPEFHETCHLNELRVDTIIQAMESLYDILEVNFDCSFDQLKASYHRLLLLTHPDKLTADKAEVEDRQNRFLKIKHAWEVLADAESRKAYDYQFQIQSASDMVKLCVFSTSADGRRCLACRCGDTFEIFPEDLCERFLCIPCNSCSLSVTVDMTESS